MPIMFSATSTHTCMTPFLTHVKGFMGNNSKKRHLHSTNHLTESQLSDHNLFPAKAHVLERRLCSLFTFLTPCLLSRCMHRFISLAHSLYSRLSLSRNRRDPQKHFEISVLRHIRFVALRKTPNEQPKFTNEHVI